MKNDNPWDATTLEWTAPSPPRHGNFIKPPVAYRGPYEYSLPRRGKDYTMQNEPIDASELSTARSYALNRFCAHTRAWKFPTLLAPGRDTGLWNAKVGIWLFLASEVMLFGGLFSAYIFLRLDAAPGDWPHGLLNVPVGTDEHRHPDRVIGNGGAGLGSAEDAWTDEVQIYMAVTILCGVIFLVVKLAYEWPQKYDHFGAYIKEDALEKYEPYLGNKHLVRGGLATAQGNHRAPSQ